MGAANSMNLERFIEMLSIDKYRSLWQHRTGNCSNIQGSTMIVITKPWGNIDSAAADVYPNKKINGNTDL